MPDVTDGPPHDAPRDARHHATDDACAGCALGRRAFLRDAAARLAAVAAALGAPHAALAGPPMAAPSRTTGQTRAYPIPAGDGATIDRESEVILVRWQGAAYAFALSCPHQRTALRWQARDARFQCPKHKSRYRPDGAFIEGRATRGMDRFAVRREGDTIVVDLARLVKQSDDADGWDAAVVRL